MSAIEFRIGDVVSVHVAPGGFHGTSVKSVDVVATELTPTLARQLGLAFLRASGEPLPRDLRLATAAALLARVRRLLGTEAASLPAEAAALLERIEQFDRAGGVDVPTHTRTIEACVELVDAIAINEPGTVQICFEGKPGKRELEIWTSGPGRQGTFRMLTVGSASPIGEGADARDEVCDDLVARALVWLEDKALEKCAAIETLLPEDRR